MKPARVEECSSAHDGSRLANIWLLGARRVRMCDITKVGTLRNAANEFSLQRYLTRCGLSRQRNDSWTLVQMAQEPSSGSGVKRSNLEAIRSADAEAEKALKRAEVLEERRATKRASATPMDELEESATNAEVQLNL